MRAVRERPDGARSCWQGPTEGVGGTWVECADLISEGGFWGRIDAYASQGPPAAVAITRTAVNELLERGQHGELHFRPPGVRHGEVVVMAKAPEVYELVAGKQYFNSVRYHLRIYFTEPIDEPGVLLLLSVDWKRDHPQGKKEQDAHAKSAYKRFKKHCSV